MADLNDIDKCRRDLYAVSIGIILFNIANGELSLPDSPTFFGSLHFHRVWVLSMSAWCFWAYFLWRFWQAARPIWSTFLADVDTEIYKTARYQEHCKAKNLALLELGRERVANPNQRNGFTGDDNYVRSVMQNASNQSGSTLYKLVPGSYGREYFHEQGIWLKGLQSSGALTSASLETWQLATERAPWLELNWRWAILRAVPFAMYREPAFSDRVLPLFIAACAPITLLARCVWHLLVCCH